MPALLRRLYAQRAFVNVAVHSLGDAECNADTSACMTLLIVEQNGPRERTICSAQPHTLRSRIRICRGSGELAVIAALKATASALDLPITVTQLSPNLSRLCPN